MNTRTGGDFSVGTSDRGVSVCFSVPWVVVQPPTAEAATNAIKRAARVFFANEPIVER